MSKENKQKTTAYNYKNKRGNTLDLNRYMYAKTLSMFEWENLPETIPYRELEKLLQKFGYAFITEVDGELYAFTGGLGGVPDVYYQPTEIVINNPALNFNKTLNLKTDGVWIRNDDEYMGLNPLFEKYNSMLVENDINMTIHGYNSRLSALITASDDRTKESAEKYLQNLIDGDIGIIGENAIFDGVKMHNQNQAGGIGISSMIEYHQYIKGALYNEIGLNTAFNMKKERLITAEAEQGEDSLFPLVYNMMKNRLKAVEAINEKYGTAIGVDFGSVWGLKNKELVDDVLNNEDDGLTPLGQFSDLPEEVAPTEEPTEESTEEQLLLDIGDEPTEEPTDEQTEETTEETTDEPTEETTDEPTEETTDEPTDESTDEPTEEPTEESTDEPTEEAEAEEEPEADNKMTKEQVMILLDIEPDAELTEEEEQAIYELMREFNNVAD